MGSVCDTIYRMRTNPILRSALLIIMTLCATLPTASALFLNVPTQASAGQPVTITTSGDIPGNTVTLYISTGAQDASQAQPASYYSGGSTIQCSGTILSDGTNTMQCAFADDTGGDITINVIAADPGTANPLGTGVACSSSEICSSWYQVEVTTPSPISVPIPDIQPGAYEPFWFSMSFGNNACPNSSPCPYDIWWSNSSTVCNPSVGTCSTPGVSCDLRNSQCTSGSYCSLGAFSDPNVEQIIPPSTSNTYGVCYMITVNGQTIQPTTPAATYMVSTQAPLSQYLVLSANPAPAFAGTPVTATLTTTDSSESYPEMYLEISSSGLCSDPTVLPNCASTLPSSFSNCLLSSSSSGSTSLTSTIDTTNLGGTYMLCGYENGYADGSQIEPTYATVYSMYISPTPPPPPPATGVVSLICNFYTQVILYLSILAAIMVFLGAVLYMLAPLTGNQTRGAVQNAGMYMVLAGVVSIIITAITVYVLSQVTGSSPSAILSTVSAVFSVTC